MKKTVVFKEIKGKKMLIGFSDPCIDPVATQVVLKSEIKKTDAYKNGKALFKEIDEKLKSAADSFRFSKEAKTESEQKKHWKDHEYRLIQVEELREKLRPILSEMKDAEKKIIEEKAIYFEPNPKKEKIISDEEFKDILVKLKTALENGKIIDIDGNEYANNVGVEFYHKVSKKWVYVKINDYGVEIPSSAILIKNLTSEQKTEIAEQTNIERISALSATDKASEKDAAIEGLGHQAATMRSSLEIQGISAAKALTQSQDWYNTELQKIEVKYA